MKPDADKTLDAGTAAVDLSGPGVPPGTDVEVRECVARAARGCTASFGELVDLYGRNVFNYLLRLVRNPHDAQDLTQDTFVKAFRALPKGEPPKNVVGWLLTIARRTALNHFRSASVAARLEVLPVSAPADPAEQASDRDDWESVWALADGLKPMLREVLWLRYGEDLSLEEICQVTKLHSIHVRVLLHRARKQLLQRLAVRGMKPMLASPPAATVHLPLP